MDLLAGILSIRDNVVTILSAGESDVAEIRIETSADPFDRLAEVLQGERNTMEEIH